MASTDPKSRRYFITIAAALVLFISGGSYAYFGIYTQTPEYIWKTSLSNTRIGLQALVDHDQPSKKSLKLDGSFKMATPIVADGTLTGMMDESVASLKLNVGAAGLRTNLELRSFPANSNGTDVYAYVSGLKDVATLFGISGQQATTINSLDGKWLVADHTLVDQLLQSTGSSPSDITHQSTTQIQKDVQDIEKKVVVVLNERLFTDDKSKAVIVIKDKLAKENFEGRKSQHYRVRVQKQQLHDFAIAVKDALKNSKLNTWLVAPNSGTTFEKVTNFDSILKNIDAVNHDNAVADLWMDLGTKTIRDVRIYASPTDAKSYVDFMFDYKGGDDYPLLIKSVSNNAEGKQNLVLNITLNRATNKITMAFSGLGTNLAGRQLVDVGANLSLTPTNDKVSVDKPTSATNIVDILGGSFGLKQTPKNQLRVESPNNNSTFDASGRLQ